MYLTLEAEFRLSHMELDLFHPSQIGFPEWLGPLASEYILYCSGFPLGSQQGLASATWALTTPSSVELLTRERVGLTNDTEIPRPGP